MTPAVQTHVPTRTSTPLRPLVLWHLLSLDGPTVAALWTAAAARSAGAHAGAALLLAMFLAVWVLYAADRLLDSSSGAGGELEERHRFHHRHRLAFRLLLALAAMALAALLPRLPAVVLRSELPVGTMLATWLLLVHLPRHSEKPRRRLPKELVVGLFFAAATFAPAAALAPAARARLLVGAACFAALCSLNCLFIYRWEHRAPAVRTGAHPSTLWALRHLTLLGWLVVLLPCALAVAWHSSLLASVALAAALLKFLDRFPAPGRTVLRACADLVLLTPLLLMLLGRA